ncbi:hypothetical protein CDAR_392581 [Caerostris darwini]|uniref:Ig-like domain-containing protein n=1 Tax=Caerostris darwini TaxID=1538125 RepID=A0AAV4P2X8_9ARAC|nr:hypothetical protein CDAR_392581 [Caerostris darwini]
MTNALCFGIERTWFEEKEDVYPQMPLLKVINQRFVPKVYDYYVIRGNTAVLRCHLPASVKEYVSVESWIRNDDYVLRPTDTRSK